MPPPQRTVHCGVTNTLGRSFPSQAVYIIATRFRGDSHWLRSSAGCSDVTPCDGQRDNCQRQQAATVLHLIV